MVRVFLRPDCHLCHVTLDRIARLVDDRRPVVVETVDIESDPDLFRRNLERIPVVEVDGREVSQLEFDEAAFISALGRAPDPPGQ